MNIKLKERKIGILKDLKIQTTFKIPESSFVYMKMDVEGMSILSIPSAEVSDVKPRKVEIPEGKISVVCLNTGKAQFLKLDEKVEIVMLKAMEIIEERGE